MKNKEIEYEDNDEGEKEKTYAREIKTYDHHMLAESQSIASSTLAKLQGQPREHIPKAEYAQLIARNLKNTLTSNKAQKVSVFNQRK